ncbi:hypothetical protein L873DRAFT_1347573 [Choiromyces venosus 120613-1]|uniref:Uncharacterized protein n=1 Tax=Choiromyces venosus 120613-1 TaxID=1336337 RepID=A0A3N4K198_9PEZI|nr:hypothetical protein L873DRAFT_1347573 [Choiromyces venosus 120613-1]
MWRSPPPPFNSGYGVIILQRASVVLAACAVALVLVICYLYPVGEKEGGRKGGRISDWWNIAVLIGGCLVLKKWPFRVKVRFLGLLVLLGRYCTVWESGSTEGFLRVFYR